MRKVNKLMRAVSGLVALGAGGAAGLQGCGQAPPAAASWSDGPDALLLVNGTMSVLGGNCPSGQEWDEDIGACTLPPINCTACSAMGLCGSGCIESGGCQSCTPGGSCACGGASPFCNVCPSCPCGGQYPSCNSCGFCPCGGSFPQCSPCGGGPSGGGGGAAGAPTAPEQDEEPPLYCPEPAPPAGGGAPPAGDCVVNNVAGQRAVFDEKDHLLYGTGSGQIDCSGLAREMLDVAYNTDAFTRASCDSGEWHSAGYAGYGGADNMYNYLRSGQSPLGEVETFTGVTLKSFGLRAGDLVFWNYRAGDASDKRINHQGIVLSPTELAHSRGKTGAVGSGPTLNNPQTQNWLQDMGVGGTVEVYVLRPNYCNSPGGNGSGSPEG